MSSGEKRLRDGKEVEMVDVKRPRMSGKGKCKVVMLVGGPTSGTRFRPLTFDVPKPLVPLAGVPLLGHHINSCTQLLDHGLIEVILIGFFENEVFQEFCAVSSAKLGVPVKYFKEPLHLGTAGGLAFFHKEIVSDFNETEENVLFVLHGDVLCSFPLTQMLTTYQEKKGAGGCILGRNVSAEDVHHYGCLVYDKGTNEILHYVEKPESDQILSNTVNCGVYLFSVSRLYKHLEEIRLAIRSDADTIKRSPSPLSSSSSSSLSSSSLSSSSSRGVLIRMEYDLLPRMSEEHQLYVLHFDDWWVPIKHPAAALESSDKLFKERERRKGEKNDKIPFNVSFVSSKENSNISGNVYVHPTAKVDPTAFIGPNVSIYENCIIGPGVRVSNSIVFSNSILNAHSCVLYSILCMDSVVGQWSRIEGQPNSAEGITVVGKGVDIGSEIIVRSTIVLPHKNVSENTENKILL